MLKIRRPLGRRIFNMGIATPGKTVFLIETAPCCFAGDIDLWFSNYILKIATPLEWLVRLASIGSDINCFDYMVENLDDWYCRCLWPWIWHWILKVKHYTAISEKKAGPIDTKQKSYELFNWCVHCMILPFDLTFQMTLSLNCILAKIWPWTCMAIFNIVYLTCRSDELVCRTKSAKVFLISPASSALCWDFARVTKSETLCITDIYFHQISFA